jgi:hypothetical protein
MIYEEINTVNRPQRVDGIAIFGCEQEVMMPSETPSNPHTAYRMTAIDTDIYINIFQ